MGKAVQIRDVDDHTYRVLRTRAAAEGMSLTTYLRRELERLASAPTMAEWLSRATDRTWGVDGEEIVRVIREGRDGEDDGR